MDAGINVSGICLCYVNIDRYPFNGVPRMYDIRTNTVLSNIFCRFLS